MRIVFIASFLLTVSFLLSAQTITFTTNKTVGETIKMSIGVNGSDVPVQVDYGNGSLVEYTITGIYGTEVTGNISGATISVFVEDAKLVLFNCMYQGLQTINTTNATQLVDLYVGGNQLSQLNLLANDQLDMVYAAYNQLTEVILPPNNQITKLDFTSNLLSSLDLSHTTNIKQLLCKQNNFSSFDVSSLGFLETIDFTQNDLSQLDVQDLSLLESLYLSGNNSMTDLTLGNNVALTTIYCGTSKVAALDLSQCQSLLKLDARSSQLIQFDLSFVSLLEYFIISDVNLGGIDLSNNPSLVTLGLANTGISTLDLSMNPSITFLDVKSNSLSQIDWSQVPDLDSFYGEDNNFRFSTLPSNDNMGVFFRYSPQSEVSMKESYDLFEEIDLSSEHLIREVSSVYTWKKKNGAYLIEGNDYTQVKPGVFTFASQPNEMVYCEIRNDYYPSLTLTTEAFELTTPTGLGSNVSGEIRIEVQNQSLILRTKSMADAEVFTLSGVKLYSGRELSDGAMLLNGYSGYLLVRINVGTRQEVHRVFVPR